MKNGILLLTVVLTILVVVGLGILAFWHFSSHDSSMALSKETTYLVEPLDERGVPDYYLAINQEFGADVSPEKNAVVWLRRAIGLEDIDAKWREGYIDLLGADFSSDVESEFVDWHEYSRYDEDQTASMYSAILTRSWSREQYPEVYQWLASCDRHLQLVLTASQQKAYFEPLAVDSTVLPAQKVLRALVARAMLHCGEEDPMAGWQELLACHRLMQLAHSASCWGQLLPYLEVASDVFRADQVLMRHESLSASQIQSIRVDVRALGDDTLFVTMLDFTDRCIALDAMLRDSQFQVSVPERQRAMRMFNRRMDDVVNALSMPTYRERVRLIEKIDAHDRVMFKQDAGDFGSAEGMFAYYSCPVFSFWVYYHERHAVMRRLIEVALALEAYSRQETRFPAGLAELVPAYLGSVPADPFDGSELKYVQRDRGYVLYSVGHNGITDGEPSEEEEKESDDIVIMRE